MEKMLTVCEKCKKLDGPSGRLKREDKWVLDVALREFGKRGYMPVIYLDDDGLPALAREYRIYPDGRVWSVRLDDFLKSSTSKSTEYLRIKKRTYRVEDLLIWAYEPFMHDKIEPKWVEDKDGEVEWRRPMAYLPPGMDMHWMNIEFYMGRDDESVVWGHSRIKEVGRNKKGLTEYTMENGAVHTARLDIPMKVGQVMARRGYKGGWVGAREFFEMTTTHRMAMSGIVGRWWERDGRLVKVCPEVGERYLWIPFGEEVEPGVQEIRDREITLQTGVDERDGRPPKVYSEYYYVKLKELRRFASRGLYEEDFKFGDKWCADSNMPADLVGVLPEGIHEDGCVI